MQMYYKPYLSYTEPVVTKKNKILMKSVQIPEVVLSSGHKMPLIGLGTMSHPLPPSDQLTAIFVNAIEAGYRHFDTAAIYKSEEPLGRAVAEALDRGLIHSRDQIFITSKLWCSAAHPDLVVPALHRTLRNLGLDYVDLYLIHQPLRLKQGVEGFKISGEDLLPFDIKGTWEAMEECHRLGLAKSVGVSNFGSKKLSQILQHGTIPPAVNQVEMNAVWQQQKLREFCRSKGIHMSAWSPLGAAGTFWGSEAVMENTILRNIAAAKGKSVAQVALRWIYEQGASVVVKSFNGERMKENLDIFDWKLNNDEVLQIQQIPQCRGFTGEVFIHPDGPYKSLEDFWDGDA